MKVTKANHTVVIESSLFRDTYTQIEGIPYGKPAHWRRVSEHKLGGTLARVLNGNGSVATRRLNRTIANALELGHRVTIDGVGVVLSGKG